MRFAGRSSGRVSAGFGPVFFILLALWCFGGNRAAEAGAAKGMAPLSSGRTAIAYVPGEILVKFKSSPLRESGPRAFITTGGSSLPAEARKAVSAIQGRVAKSYPLVGMDLVAIPSSMTMEQAIDALRRSGTVEFAEPNYRVQALTLPDDPMFKHLWGLRNTGQEISGKLGRSGVDISAPKAWGRLTDGSSTLVAVIDTGVDYTHEDLAANMWVNPNEIPDNGIDDDGNGYVDDVYGINAMAGTGDPMDDNGHGTHCSGTIGAVGNNGKGITGVAWKAKLMALKFLDSRGGGDIGSAIECIAYALSIKRANGYSRMVLSNSWGVEENSLALRDAIEAAEREGVLFVVAAGNDGRDIDVYPTYPAAYDLPNIISVGSMDNSDHANNWSNYGVKNVDLFAPGDGIFSTLPGNGYGYGSGTSMATPHVSGACALVWSQFPDVRWPTIKSMILNGARDGVTDGFKTKCLTGGRLNLRSSMAAALKAKPAVFSISPNKLLPGGKATLTGWRFGSGPVRVSFGGARLPADSILHCDNRNLVIRIPDDTSRFGSALLTVESEAGVSRGAVATVGFEPAVIGQTVIGHDEAATAQTGKFVWLISGKTDWGVTGLVERYDLSTGESVIDERWMIPEAVVAAGAARIGKAIYVAGGVTAEGAVSDRLQIFDTSTGKWSEGPPLPEPRAGAAAAACGNRLFVFGGSLESEFGIQTVFIYDVRTRRWQRGADMPQGTSMAAAVGAEAGKIWVMGGFGPVWEGLPATLDTVQEYDSASDTWTLLPSLSVSRSGLAAVNAGYVFCLGGTSDGATYHRGGEHFARIQERWLPSVVGMQPLFGAAAAHKDRRVYVIGGATTTAAFEPAISRNVWAFSRP